MNTIRVIGQVITSVDYATTKLFNMNPEPLKEAAEHFLAAGVTELEVPMGFLDPNNKFPDKGVDEETLKQTLDILPEESKIIASYIGGGSLGKDSKDYLEKTKRVIDHFVEYCPDLDRTMIHPPHIKDLTQDDIQEIINVWAELARHAADVRPGFQCCLHNHYDSSCETAEQVSMYLQALRSAEEPALTWGPDTGHCHGMKEKYLEIFEQNADLIGNHFHIKARVAAFDQLHGGDDYAADRDLWGNKAEFGRGLYGGFVNCADPEIHTPFKEVFEFIKTKAQPSEGVVTGAVEIDIPRQHPKLEVLCSILYLKQVHGLEGAIALSYEEIIERVFSPQSR
jgi:sugar phosphate isomerase/epimerase